MAVGIISLKLGKCVTAPTKRMIKDLNDIAEMNRAVKNAIARTWITFHDDNPDWEPGQATTRDRKTGEETLKFDAKGKPIMEIGYGPSGLGRDLYRAGVAAEPKLHSSITSMASQAVIKKLQAKMPWNHDGSARFFYEAILAHEVHLPRYNKGSIHFAPAELAFAYKGECSPCKMKAVTVRMADLGQHYAVVRIPMWSRKSSRDVKDCIFRVEVRQMSRGNRKLLEGVANGEVKLRGSALVYRDKDKSWYFNLTYDAPTKNLELNPENVATITMLASDGKNPFAINCGKPRWTLGKARMLEYQYDRVKVRRSSLRERYRIADRSGKGHGKKRFFEKTKPMSRAFVDLQAVFTGDLVAEVIKFCKRFDCGTVIFREPTMPLRKHDWFGKRDMAFNWTLLNSKLVDKCANVGIDLKINPKPDGRLGMKEFFEKYPNRNTKDSAKEPVEVSSEEPVEASVEKSNGKVVTLHKSKRRKLLPEVREALDK